MANRAATKKPQTLIYLYGITREIPAKLRLPEAVDGSAAVEAFPCGEFSCWISRVDPAEFGDSLQTHMQDLEWLAAASVRHQRVVAAIFEKTVILPARFATLFRSEQSLARHVSKSQRELRKSFERLKGRHEYGVKIFAESSARGQASAAASGRDYLRRKSEMLAATASTISPELERFIAGLREMAVEVAEGGAVSGGQRRLVWHGSLLLGRSDRAQLDAALATFSRDFQGRYRIECSGPWPPYSFIGGSVRAQGT